MAQPLIFKSTRSRMNRFPSSRIRATSLLRGKDTFEKFYTTFNVWRTPTSQTVLKNPWWRWIATEINSQVGVKFLLSCASSHLYFLHMHLCVFIKYSSSVLCRLDLRPNPFNPFYLLESLASTYLLESLVSLYLVESLASIYLLESLASTYLLESLASIYLLESLAFIYLLESLASLRLSPHPPQPHPYYSSVFSSYIRGFVCKSSRRKKWKCYWWIWNWRDDGERRETG